MKIHIPSLLFVRKALKRFMPGEIIEDAIIESRKFNSKNIGIVFTRLGENIYTASEAEAVANHYIKVLKKISEERISAEISLKLTQIGYDISPKNASSEFDKILKAAVEHNNFVWIDMEQSKYTSQTIEFYKSFRNNFSNAGICLQAYLKRTSGDIIDLLPVYPSIRLVKGAYMEAPDVAFAQKSLVDHNYFELSKELFHHAGESSGRIAFATHDIILISKIKDYAASNGISREKFEFQMLYGIKPAEQIKLAKEGYKLKVLISYGEAWYSWYMRRLAERPANIWFVMKNILAK